MLRFFSAIKYREEKKVLSCFFQPQKSKYERCCITFITEEGFLNAEGDGNQQQICRSWPLSRLTGFQQLSQNSFLLWKPSHTLTPFLTPLTVSFLFHIHKPANKMIKLKESRQIYKYLWIQGEHLHFSDDSQKLRDNPCLCCTNLP